MKCPKCKKRQMRQKIGDYHYVESGLDNLHLSGITIYECPNCKSKAPEIPNIKGLHRSIAYGLATKPTRLFPQEIRFLRKHLRIKSKEFADFLGVSPVTYSGWETGRKNNSFSHDRQIRMAFFILAGLDDKFAEHARLEVFKEKMGQVEDEKREGADFRVRALPPTIVSPHFSYVFEQPLTK